MTFRRISIVLLTVILLFSLASCAVNVGESGVLPPSESQKLTSAAEPQAGTPPTETEIQPEKTPEMASVEPTADTSLLIEGENYYDLTNVVLYLELYGELPPNFITKTEARKLGWSGGSVENYIEGGAIGGDFFGNYEGLLPKANGRSYNECDIDTDNSNGRGSKRLVFSNDGLYFYTSDHYESFSQVYVTEDFDVIW
ncbi:MAG: ribonuclease [Oscillospiraceae bacterium]|nr:ribonuclease [Oscillospiraceae bacterium]